MPTESEKNVRRVFPGARFFHRRPPPDVPHGTAFSLESRVGTTRVVDACPAPLAEEPSGGAPTPPPFPQISSTTAHPDARITIVRRNEDPPRLPDRRNEHHAVSPGARRTDGKRLPKRLPAEPKGTRLRQLQEKSLTPNRFRIAVRRGRASYAHDAAVVAERFKREDVARHLALVESTFFR